MLSLPILSWISTYQRSWVRADVIAGLTVTALLIPEGMAYAQLAGVPPETAFYAAPIGLILYAVFGTSRQLVVAVSAAIAAMSAATVGGIAPEGSGEFITLTAALALLAGLISIGAGMLKLGRIAQFFSESVMTGFVFGLAMVIAIKQVPKMFGIESGHGNFFERLWDIFKNLDETHARTLLLGLTCLALMLLLEHFVERIPAALVVLVYGIVVSTILDLHDRGVEVVGKISGGLAAPRIPDIGWHDLTLLIGGAAGLALVVFAEGIGPARVFASKHHHRIDPNQELIGLGAANGGAGLFQGFPIGSSLSKSAANDAAGAMTQMSAIVAAGFTILVALFLTPLFENLPEATLGAIVVVAVSGMMHLGEMKRLASLRRADFALAMTALAGVLIFEVLTGLLIAVIASLAVLVWRASQPKLSVLGRRAETLEFSSVGQEEGANAIPGLFIVRPDESIFFANAAPIRDSILAGVHETQPTPKAVLLNLQATTDLDIPGADMVAELHEDLERDGIELMLCHVHENARGLLDRSGVVAKIGAEHIYPRALGGMLAFLAKDSASEAARREIVGDGLRRTREVVREMASVAEPGERARLEEIADGLASLDTAAR